MASLLGTIAPSTPMLLELEGEIWKNLKELSDLHELCSIMLVLSNYIDSRASQWSPNLQWLGLVCQLNVRGGRETTASHNINSS